MDARITEVGKQLVDAVHKGVVEVRNNARAEENSVRASTIAGRAL